MQKTSPQPPISAEARTGDNRMDLHRLRTFYKKGTVIFREEDRRDNAYIIERGLVEISTTRDSKTIPLVRLGSGEVFGETALLGDGKRSATAVAVEDTEVFLISPALLRDRIMHLDPLVGLLMSLLVSRYRQWRYKAADQAPEIELVSHEERGVFEGEADAFMDPDETVLGVVGADGTAKCYSAWQLDGHEIVNDVLDGQPITATW